MGIISSRIGSMPILQVPKGSPQGSLCVRLDSNNSLDFRYKITTTTTTTTTINK